MNTEALKSEVKQVIIALEAIASAPHAVKGFGDGYKQVGLNYSLESCEIAAEITGIGRTFCKMLNHKFRTDAANMMFKRAMGKVHA